MLKNNNLIICVLMLCASLGIKVNLSISFTQKYVFNIEYNKTNNRIWSYFNNALQFTVPIKLNYAKKIIS